MIREFAKKLNIFALVICIIALQFTIAASAENKYPSFASLYSSTSGASIPVRTEPGINSNPNSVVKGWLSSGEIVKALGEARDPDGDLWYLIGYGVGYNETGYVLPRQIGQFLGYYTEDAAFEAKLNEQNFPESYKVKLRELHFLYPSWQFIAENIDMNFADAVAGERTNPGLKLVHPTRDESWRSTDPNTYNPETKTWETYDGGWYSASKEVVEYFMDPRNMLDYKTVFIFSPHNYNEKYDTEANLQRVLANTFMSGALQDDETKTYLEVIMKAGKDNGVSPMSMAAKFIQEQGSNGAGKCITGAAYKGYEGIYNFFNVGAYADSKRDTIERGLWWASGESSNKTTYGRPWNTREKSIVGGAQWYAESYVNVGQNSYYYMNFNIKGSNPFTHQYATNIEDAASKARLVSNGYIGIKDLEIAFYIPIYKNMPESTTLPTIGNNDNYLKSLEVEGFTDKYSFSMYDFDYEIIVPYETAKIKINAVANSATSTISGAGERELNVGVNDIKITVTAASGVKKEYIIQVNRNSTPTGQVPKPTLEGSYKKSGDNLFGIEPKTEIGSFISKLGLKNGTLKILNSANAEKTTGYIGTGDKVSVYNNVGALDATYVVAILGDCDGDGEIKSRDLLIGQRSILKIEALGGIYEKAMDIDKDGVVKSRDLLMGQRHILRIETIKQ